MIRLNVSQFNVFIKILEDEVERHKFWLETKDFVSTEELNSIEEEFNQLSEMFEEMKLKKQRLLTLMR